MKLTNARQGWLKGDYIFCSSWIVEHRKIFIVLSSVFHGKSHKIPHTILAGCTDSDYSQSPSGGDRNSKRAWRFMTGRIGHVYRRPNVRATGWQVPMTPWMMCNGLFEATAASGWGHDLMVSACSGPVDVWHFNQVSTATGFAISVDPIIGIYMQVYLFTVDLRADGIA